MVSPSLAHLTGQLHITGLPMLKDLPKSKLVLRAPGIRRSNSRPQSQDPNRPIVAIFETADAAGRAIAASPTENY
ncbi:hypothetical protein N7501_002135 [Penicillium viridicatum]|nr:hypothetical protein N7501_002135 [Penicillium viridicatum]